jgi:hypothetical protein
MNKQNTENLRSKLEDNVKGNIQLEAYKSDSFELSDWTLTSVLDDILMVQYVDVSETGREVLRNGIYVSVDVTTHVWRVGKVILAGPNCKFTKQGDHVVFPNDKGIRASNINDIKNIVFLNEARIFGVCKLKNDTV